MKKMKEENSIISSAVFIASASYGQFIDFSNSMYLMYEYAQFVIKC